MNEIERKASQMSYDEMAQVYQNVFSTPGGKLVLADLKLRCYVDVSTVTSPDSVYTNEVIFKEGMRTVFLHINSAIEHMPGGEATDKEPEDASTS